MARAGRAREWERSLPPSPSPQGRHPPEPPHMSASSPSSRAGLPLSWPRAPRPASTPTLMRPRCRVALRPPRAARPRGAGAEEAEPLSSSSLSHWPCPRPPAATLHHRPHQPAPLLLLPCARCRSSRPPPGRLASSRHNDSGKRRSPSPPPLLLPLPSSSPSRAAILVTDARRPPRQHVILPRAAPARARPLGHVPHNHGRGASPSSPGTISSSSSSLQIGLKA